MIAIKNAGISGLPSVINAVIITSAASSANSYLYIGSRYLFALSQLKQAPQFFLACTNSGVPYRAVLITASIGLLTFLSAGSGGPELVFSWFLNLTTVAGLFNWCCICIAYIRFYAALKAQGIDRNSLPYKSPFQPYLAWIALTFFTIVILFNGFGNFVTGKWNVRNFLASYLGIPIFFLLYGSWKIFRRTKFRDAVEVDLMTGKGAVDAQEALAEELLPKNALEKIWHHIV